MNCKKHYLLILLLLVSLGLNAQQVIVVEHNNTPYTFERLDSAVVFASNGDDIYISGGSFNIDTVEINKSLKIYGAGINIDSSSATSITVFTGHIRFVAGSDNSLLTGVKLAGDILFGNDSTDDNVNNVSIVRCEYTNLKLNHGSISTSNASNINITESILNGELHGGSVSGLFVDKCVIKGKIGYLLNAVFKNCIFAYYGTAGSWGPGWRCKNEVFKVGGYCLPGFSPSIYQSQFLNCIFLDNLETHVNNVRNCTFKNNAFYNSGINFNANHGNVGSSNVFGFRTSDFISYNADPWQADYRIKNDSIYSNSGDDGTDPGIYGTSQPFKDGSIPINPHIQSKIIRVQNNTLQLQIEVEAQKR